LAQGVGSFVANSLDLVIGLVRPVRQLGYLVSLLLIVLLIASWTSTMIGIGNLASSHGADLNLIGWVFVSIVCLATTALMWLMLEHTRMPRHPFLRVVTGAAYLFLLVWTASFGYSFWWGALAARADSDSQIADVIKSLDQQLTGVHAQLNAVSRQMSTAEQAAQKQQKFEETSGGSCGIPSPPGRSVLYQARQSVTANVDNISMDVDNWLSGVNAEIDKLDEDRKIMAGASNASAEARNVAFGEAYDSAQKSATVINAASRASARTVSGLLESQARALSIPPGQSGFTCFDSGLAGQLKGTAQGIEQSPIYIQLPLWRPLEGNASAEEGFIRLWGTAGAPFSHMSAADASLNQMHGRDWLALIAAIAVDGGIFILTLLRPRGGLEGFMTDTSVDREVQHEVTRILRSHQKAAALLLYELHFQYGRNQYIVVPDILWSEPGQEQPRSLHLAMAMLKRRLSTRRLTNPSPMLLKFARHRLAELNWTPRTPIDQVEERGWWQRLRRHVRGSTAPGHPIIYQIDELERNEAIRLLHEGSEPAPEPREERSHRRAEERYSRQGQRESRLPAIPFSPSGIDRVYAGAMSLMRDGFHEQAEGFIQAIRAELPALQERGIEVVGLDNVVGQIHNPKLHPFTVVGQATSSRPSHEILEVATLAFVQPTITGHRVLREGAVIVSEGPSDYDGPPDPDLPPALDVSQSPHFNGQESMVEEEDDGEVDPRDWMPD
jgi:hypothetical protein